MPNQDPRLRYLVPTLLVLILSLPTSNAQHHQTSAPPYPSTTLPPNAYSPPVSTRGFTPPSAYHIRKAHAILACLAFLFFFPLGGITLRVLEHRVAAKPIPIWIIWVHTSIQMFGLAVFCGAAGLGIYTARSLGVVNHYHPIIGLTILSLLIIQPLTEVLNVLFFKPGSRIIYLAHVHLWLGRFLITAGIVNGGLGFAFAASMPGGTANIDGNWPRIVYGVSATVVWLVYVWVCLVWGEWTRGNRERVRLEGGGGEEDMEGLQERQGEGEEEGLEMEQRRGGRKSVKASPAL